jgi:hypothetical protein
MRLFLLTVAVATTGCFDSYRDEYDYDVNGHTEVISGCETNCALSCSRIGFPFSTCHENEDGREICRCYSSDPESR